MGAVRRGAAVRLGRVSGAQNTGSELVRAVHRTVDHVHALANSATMILQLEHNREEISAAVTDSSDCGAGWEILTYQQ